MHHDPAKLNPDDPLGRAATNALQSCLAVQPHESLLVVTDAGCAPIGRALAGAAEALGLAPVLMEMPVAPCSGSEPPTAVAAAMAASAVSVCPLSKSITHTAARREACAAGGRVATMPGITEDCMVRCLAADYERIAAVTLKLTERLSVASEARLSCPLGTDLRLPLRGIEAIASTGLIREPGQGGNLPSGEAYLMPQEGKTEGVLFVDGSMADVGILSEPLRIEISGGRAVRITGGREAGQLERSLDTHGAAARNVAELGVGTNDQARITGHVLEDEKVAGTVHVALGNNVGMGGTVDVPIHLDGVLRRPTLALDGTVVVTAGRLELG
jgi:leucyl aminopeptidase (aminopeptidase T)